jgi:hypothetical protein
MPSGGLAALYFVATAFVQCYCRFWQLPSLSKQIAAASSMFSLLYD